MEISRINKKLILHLGGGLNRANKCIQLANEHPDAKIFVSSEGGDVLKYYTDHGIDAQRITLDNDAWDTVTNFTHTRKRIKNEFDPNLIFVVTHDFHMNRSMKIANAVYWLRNVRLVAQGAGGPNPYGPEYNFTEPDKLIQEDHIRAWIWRLTGFLFYWKSVREARKDVCGAPKKWNEIGL
jgi:uncharacterized SAM-binding protein YcdF (DUF218 family)